MTAWWKACLFGVLAAVSALLLAAPALANGFDDVPEDHWAYDALDYLQEAGLVEGYPDGTFKGDRSFTRYEMAMVIARVFTKMQDFQASIESGTGQASGDVDNKEVYARLDRLSDEFRDELTSLGARVTAVEDEQVRLRGDVDDLKQLIKDSGLSGDMRVRGGTFFNTGSHTVGTDIGWESAFRLNYMFQPERNTDVRLSLMAWESDGLIGSYVTPGLNNEQPGQVATPPYGMRTSGSSFLIDEMNVRYRWDNAPNVLGKCPEITIGRQYFSQGEFGLAGDNGFRSNFGIRYDTCFGANFDGYLGYYRMRAANTLAPWANDNPPANQSSATVFDGDDYLLAGLEYHSGESEMPGHSYKMVARADIAPNGFGREQYVSASGNMELPWFNDTFLNGIRGEWVYVMQNAAGQNPDDDLGVTPYSWIVELDLYNNGKSRVSIAGAQIASVEGLPVLANVDNDPFSEYDYTVNQTADAYNFSKDGRNYFPSDFNGFGVQAEHTFGSKLHSTLTWYNGKRIDATASDRPGLLRLRLKYPLTDNSTLGLDLAAAGERANLEDPIGLVRGEYKIKF
jgi:hypothetical protein